MVFKFFILQRINFLPRVFIIALLSVIFCCHVVYGQGLMEPQLFQSHDGGPGAWAPVHKTPGFTTPGVAANDPHVVRKGSDGPNYSTFTVAKQSLSEEAKAANAGYENNPDYGLLYQGAPCSDCYELIGERTETTKTFVREGTKNGKKEKMEQTSTKPLHYRDAKGNWVTIKTQLAPDAANKGIYSIPDEATPLAINTNNDNSFSTLGKNGEMIRFNHNLELVYVQPDGKEVSLGIADYTHHTAGDGGVYVTNAWPGIDIEMNVLRAAVKTNFHVNHAMPQYAAGKLLIRDHLQLDNGLSLNATSGSVTTGELKINDNAGAPKYGIGAATVYEKDNRKNTLQPLEYLIGDNNVLDIALPGTYLNKEDNAYPIIVDPLVTLATTSAVAGSTYVTALTATSGCEYTNPAWTPTNCTVTDIQFQFQYTCVNPMGLEYGGTFFYLGTCRSPGILADGYIWSCAGALPGTCTATGGTAYSIWGTAAAATSGLGPCVPAPQCASYELNIDMYFLQGWENTVACASTWCYASQPLIITVVGETVELTAAGVVATPATICAGSSSTLTATGLYGVPPYTYAWTPGPLTGSPVVVSPLTTTTYDLTVTDACGITTTGNVTVTVITEDAITGTLALCVGNTTTLADGTAGGHTWISTNTGVATITSPGGVVTAVGAGTTTISYTTTATGCYATAIVTVYPTPTAILGTETVCVGGTTSLSDATGGFTWSSSNTLIATVGATGIVTGVATGTATITYGNATCYVTATVTVDLLSPITGTLTVCEGSTTTLHDAAGTSTWVSGTTGVATIGATTGIVTGVSGGTSVITFTTAAGCSTTAIVTVNAISPITGTLVLCAGSTSTLEDAAGGGTWSSGTVGVATIGLTTGVVTGVANGTSTIVYTTAAGCTATAIVSVDPISPITGTLSVCEGNTTTLGDATGGGTWSSGTVGVATIGLTTGIVTGVSGGTSTIVYTTGAGCTTTAIVTVNPISPITGTLSVCEGSTTTLADATGGGTWSSGTVGVATIGLTTGVVTGVAGGTSTIVYTTAAGCTATAIVTVNPITPITGTLSVCEGATTTLADAGGGTWSSSTVGVATIGLTTGIVTGVAGGTSTIVYTTPAGCTTTAIVTVNPISPITGTLILCVGSTSTLADATGGGTWNSGTVGVATIGLTTGLVTAVANGTTTIVYTTAAGCTATAIVTVNPLSAITGTLTVCEGSTTTLADAAGGGTWSSGTVGVATIGLTTGVVTGVAGGTSAIVYTTGAGCTISAVVTVNPVAPITGVLSVCAGLTTTLANAVGGGTWGSGTVGVATIGLTTGVVTGIANGTSTIVYTTPAGCTSTAIVTVNPISAITGTLKVCEGSTTTLGDATAGGTWSSGTVGVATIGLTTGIVTGVTGGTSTIVYTTAAGCTATAVVTVNPLAPITGTLELCVGSTSTLADAVGGGTWSSGTPGVAIIGLTTGLVTAVANGTTTIVYTTPAGCTTTAVVTVNALSAITGTLKVCEGSTTTLADAAGGGTWSSGTPGVATIGLTTGIVTGVTGGTSTIVYTTAAGCNISAIVTVDPVAPITGIFSLCAGNNITLADVLGGGTWSSTNTLVATIGAGTGVVNALTSGTTTISYLLPTGCYSTATFTVNTVAGITGVAEVCVGSTTTLNDATGGGTWASGTPAVATIGIGTGIVTGVSGGNTTITYTSASGCTTTDIVTVNPVPVAITGITSVCVGLTISLSDVTPGGVWISSNGSVAGVNTSGIVTGVTGGGATITYKLPGGCYITIPVIVNPLPAAISGPGTVCLGSSITLNDVSAGGTWSSSNTAIATIGAGTGVVMGVGAGIANITYTLATGCLINAPVTVIPLPGAPATVNLDYCQNAPSVALTATGSNLLWYTSLTSTPGSSTAPIPSTTVPGVTTWYVSQTVNGCEGPRAPLQVNVHIVPVFNIVAVRPTSCMYDSITYFSAGPTFPGETYSWSLPSNGVLYPGSSFTNSSIIMDFDTVLGFNYVVLTVGDGYPPCNVTDSIPMTVYISSPQATFYVKPDICVGDSVTIALSYIGPDVNDFTWNFGGATIVAASSNSGGPFLVTWPTAGIYTVALTAISNVNCPSHPIVDTVDVHALPDATFTFKPKSNNVLCLEDSVLFIANDTAYNDSYLWQPVHGFNNDNKRVIWGKVEETQSDITLTVTDPFGCVGTSMQQLDANSCCTVLFPNAFTPNGDGKNDVFRPLFSGYHNFHFFRIANRWGETIFESENSLPAWDGTFNGVAQDIGTYFYYIQYDCGGNTIEAKGDVTLIR